MAGQTPPSKVAWDGVEALSAAEWRRRATAHEQRVDELVSGHLSRRSRNEAHPVEDFLFTYYSHRPAALRRWHPGWGVRLDQAAEQYQGVRGYLIEGGSARVDPGYATLRRDELSEIAGLLGTTADRPAALGCFGFHEWAMVYRSEGIRHDHVPLRLGQAETDRVVESHRLTCTHYDAYRFFTPGARPRNGQQPTLATRIQHEQPGCLHANMDVYKWAYKLTPFVASEIVADAFVLARRIRELDMRASPYDLRTFGYSPVRIETPAGKAEYVQAQRAFAEEASRIRQALLRTCQRVLAESP